MFNYSQHITPARLDIIRHDVDVIRRFVEIGMSRTPFCESDPYLSYFFFVVDKSLCVLSDEVRHPFHLHGLLDGYQSSLIYFVSASIECHSDLEFLNSALDLYDIFISRIRLDIREICDTYPYGSDITSALSVISNAFSVHS